jgi:phosphoribosylamine-glycine ligase
MRVACVDSWGMATSWWLRLQAEGCDVRVYMKSEDCNVGATGDGLVRKEPSYDRLVSWAKESPEDTVVLFCQSLYGDKADELRRAGLKVVGGGSFADKLEKDREFGQNVAERIGFAIPEFQSFKTLSDAIDGCRNRPDGGVFKTNTYIEADATQVKKTGEELVSYIKNLRERYHDRVSCIIQELIGGKRSVDLDVTRWWDGNEFVGPHEIALEKKRFLNDDFGPSTGCALNAVWFQEDNPLEEDLDYARLAELLRDHEAPAAPYSVNFRISDEDGKPYFLEWTPRMGYDCCTTVALLYDSLSEMLWRVATGQGGTGVSDDLSYSVRLSVPPYPFEYPPTDGKHTPDGLLLGDLGDGYSPPFIAGQVRSEREGEYRVAGHDGIIGCAVAIGDDLETMADGVRMFCDDLHDSVSKLQCRSDGAAVIQEDARKLEALGIDTHPAILKSAEEKVA